MFDMNFGDYLQFSKTDELFHAVDSIVVICMLE